MRRLSSRLTVASVTFGAGLLAWVAWAVNYDGGIYRRLPWGELASFALCSLAAFCCFTLAPSGARPKGRGGKLFRWLMLACGGLLLLGAFAAGLGEAVRVLNRVIMARNGVLEYY